MPHGCGTWCISHCPVNVLWSSLAPRRTASTDGATAHLIRFLFENLSLLLKQTCSHYAPRLIKPDEARNERTHTCADHRNHRPAPTYPPDAFTSGWTDSYPQFQRPFS
ncbi:hypothetical protein PSEUDO9AZ_20174 [Pseudomonas sp. 9AZ]|nr:hypothetical protein PSEUDO9AZ_20174 [Pseudomonas sp. 9AZ]